MPQTVQLNSKLFRCQSDESKVKVQDGKDRQHNLFLKYTTEAYRQNPTSKTLRKTKNLLSSQSTYTVS